MSTTLEFPRQFIAADLKLDHWDAIEPYFQKLTEREIDSRESLDQWLRDVTELLAAIDEEGSRRYTAMTCNTTDAAIKQSFLAFIENIEPKCEPWQHKLQEKVATAATQLDLPSQRYEVLVRSAKNAIELFRDENIPLFTEDKKLQTRYQEITGGMTVTFRGEELTMQQVRRHLEDTDRPTREEAWRLFMDRYQHDAPALNELYAQMVTLRNKIARNAGLPDYRAYAFRTKERFDYTPEDCLAFHDAIERVCVPAVQAMADERKTKLGLDKLCPWDFEVDADGRPPLRPFEEVDQLIDGCAKIFHEVDSELGGQFDQMRTQNLLDLGSRRGKAPGGYQAVYAEQRMPFIFMNAVGTESDVRTLLHEGGHAFHTFATRQEPILSYRHAPMEFCEVASMAMECLGLPHLETFFGENTGRAKKKFFAKIVDFFPWMARVDAFQHHVYTHVDETIDRRNDYWQSLTRRFAPHLDYTGLEAMDRHSWHQKLHFFEVPFYYVEYGIAPAWCAAGLAEFAQGLPAGGRVLSRCTGPGRLTPAARALRRREHQVRFL
jgi:oligoendopeptidase F